AALVGLAIAVATVAFPAWRNARSGTVVADRVQVGRARTPRWAQAGLDFWFLGASAVVFWVTSRSGYQLVLAPEGVPAISVSYWAFAGPALLWAGTGLICWRLGEFALRRGRGLLAGALRPAAGPMAGTVAASLSRQRHRLARGVVMVGLTT